MTKSQTAFRWIALLLALMLLVPLASCGGQGEVTPTPTTNLTPAPTSTAATAPPSTISSLSGEVLVQKSGSTTWVTAAAGMKLEAGDRVKTGGDGTVLLLFFEGSTMEVQTDTEILINELSLAAGTGSTTISLTQMVGNTVNRVQKLVDSESKYEIETPAASAVVRGTVFTVIVEGDGFTIVESDEGDVWLCAGGVCKLIKAGEHSSAAVGGIPSDPLPNATPTPAQTPAPTPTPATTPAPTPTPAFTPTPAPTATATLAPVYYLPPPELTPTPEFTPTPTPELTPTPTPELTPTPTPELTPTPTPELTPTPTPIGNPQVNITSPVDGSTSLTRLVTVEGTVVSDTGNTTATITLNTVMRPLALTYQSEGSYHYTFITQLELVPGSNTITVAATDTESRSGSDTVTVLADIAACAIKVELTWPYNNTDLDSHLIAPGGEFGSFYDCYYANDNPDWDGSGTSSSGDPSLDTDNLFGGDPPEHIVLCAPPTPLNGIYQYKVHYFSDHGTGLLSTATVKIFINDSFTPVFEASKQLSDGETWDCACIDWPSGTVSAGPCAITTPTPTPTPTPTLYSLTVTSQGCCPVLVEGLPAGNQTVPAGGNSTFSGIPANTQVTLMAQTDGNCTFEYWWVDDGPSSLDNPYMVIMDSDHTAEAWCSAGATPTPTPTPTPSGYSLTVTSQGCCPILVRDLPGGDQTVPAGGNMTFTGIPSGTLARITAQPGVGCKLDHWMIDGVQKPDPQDQTIYVTINSNRTVIGVCVNVPTVTLTVTTDCCSIIVSGLPGGEQIVPANSQNYTISGIPANTQVTLSPQLITPCYGVESWWLDGEFNQSMGSLELTMGVNHTVQAYCNPG